MVTKTAALTAKSWASVSCTSLVPGVMLGARSRARARRTGRGRGRGKG